MKISVIHSIYKPETRGGAEVVVENIVSGLKARGEDVFVITAGRKNELNVIPHLMNPKIPGQARNDSRVYRIKPFNIFNFLDINSKPAWLRLPWHLVDIFNCVQAWRIYKILKKEKPDLVLTHNLKGLGYCTLWVLRFLKIKNIHTVHDAQLLHPSGLMRESGRLGFFAGVYSWFCKKLFGSPAVVIFPSQYIKGLYEKHGFFKGSERVVLGNPVVISSPFIRGSLGGGNSTLNLLFLGQIEEYKSILDLIEAVKKTPGDLILHVVGEGSALEKAKDLAKDDARIKFYGRLTHEELEKKIWPITDVLINPSKVPESFGMVVVEALAHGVPVMVSNKGALPELIKEGETGFLINGDLGKKIEWCLNNKEKIAQMAPACLKEAEKYSLENYLNKLFEFLK